MPFLRHPSGLSWRQKRAERKRLAEIQRRIDAAKRMEEQPPPRRK